MTRFEYKVMAAPTRAPKVRGADSVESRFAVALAGVLNREGMDGWEYLRAETLPVEERAGLTGTRTSFRTVLIFRRPAGPSATADSPRLIENRGSEVDTGPSGPTLNSGIRPTLAPEPPLSRGPDRSGPDA